MNDEEWKYDSSFLEIPVATAEESSREAIISLRTLKSQIDDIINETADYSEVKQETLIDTLTEKLDRIITESSAHIAEWDNQTLGSLRSVDGRVALLNELCNTRDIVDESKLDKELRRNSRRFLTVRYVADFLARNGYIAAHTTLAEDSGAGEFLSPDALSGLDILLGQIRREDDVSGALQWCIANEAQLKRRGSKLEGKLYLHKLERMLSLPETSPEDVISLMQEKIAQRTPEVLEEASLLLAECRPGHEQHCKEKVEKIAVLVSENFMRLRGFSSGSLLEDAFDIGIRALRTDDCSPTARGEPDCPICDPVLCELAADTSIGRALPTTTLLKCPVTRRSIGDGKVFLLPTGHILSNEGVQLCRVGKEKIRCPFTAVLFNLSQVQRIYP